MNFEDIQLKFIIDFENVMLRRDLSSDLKQNNKIKLLKKFLSEISTKYLLKGYSKY